MNALVIILLMSSAAVHISLSPPNPPVKEHNNSVPNTLFEKFIQSITFFSKVMMWMGTMWDLYVSVAKYGLHTRSHDVPAAIVRLGACHEYYQTSCMVHPILVVGMLTTVTAAALRVWCFKTLGRLFTFEIDIRPEHELITCGPYAWVRHPSYTGVYLTLLGATAVLCSPGTWLVECGPGNIGAALISLLWTLKCIYVFKGMTVRLRVEDEVLREAFGERWDEYSKRVPQSLLPGII
ncbi:Protein-S-isoprenylcysteine O-methyltransferase B [Hypsizygus marmoreus]|uniref:Protein-S-isoprenylcysteine O-methyltransferase n=1 Tax=Hypsizygus marmoreus TaxID=39966 RepID=A0A369K629_HYPMA|nr:Protein-S-isoprenylcysteine O-methyltransferase B [Hypsizygus marmoreus]